MGSSADKVRVIHMLVCYRTFDNEQLWREFKWFQHPEKNLVDIVSHRDDALNYARVMLLPRDAMIRYHFVLTADLSSLVVIYHEFGNCPIDEADPDEVTLEQFYVWPAGTPRMEIWNWFDTATNGELPPRF